MDRRDGSAGTTLAIPFDRVWGEALALARRRRGWTVTAADDLTGVIRAEARTAILRSVADVEIRVALDEDGQTRVDVASSFRVGRPDLGAGTRRIRAFLRTLERRLDRRRGGIGGILPFRRRREDR